MSPVRLPLDDLITAVYCALDDALQVAGLVAQHGKLIPRRGPPPEVDDREILCLAVLQEMLGFEFDDDFHAWMETHPIMQNAFPRRLSRQKFAERRAYLQPLLQRLTGVTAQSAHNGAPPFASLTPIPSKSAARSEPVSANAWMAWHSADTARRCGCGSTG